jgi:hypothetical protein
VRDLRVGSPHDRGGDRPGRRDPRARGRRGGRGGRRLGRGRRGGRSRRGPSLRSVWRLRVVHRRGDAAVCEHHDDRHRAWLSCGRLRRARRGLGSHARRAPARCPRGVGRPRRAVGRRAARAAPLALRSRDDRRRHRVRPHRAVRRARRARSGRRTGLGERPQRVPDGPGGEGRRRRDRPVAQGGRHRGRMRGGPRARSTPP